MQTSMIHAVKLTLVRSTYSPRWRLASPSYLATTPLPRADWNIVPRPAFEGCWAAHLPCKTTGKFPNSMKRKSKQNWIKGDLFVKNLCSLGSIGFFYLKTSKKNHIYTQIFPKKNKNVTVQKCQRTKFWWNSLPNVKFKRAFGSLTPCNLWLKKSPKIKVCKFFGKVTPSKLLLKACQGLTQKTHQRAKLFCFWRGGYQKRVKPENQNYSNAKVQNRIQR